MHFATLFALGALLAAVPTTSAAAVPTNNPAIRAALNGKTNSTDVPFGSTPYPAVNTTSITPRGMRLNPKIPRPDIRTQPLGGWRSMKTDILDIHQPELRPRPTDEQVHKMAKVLEYISVNKLIYMCTETLSFTEVHPVNQAYDDSHTDGPELDESWWHCSQGEWVKVDLWWDRPNADTVDGFKEAKGKFYSLSRPQWDPTQAHIPDTELIEYDYRIPFLPESYRDLIYNCLHYSYHVEITPDGTKKEYNICEIGCMEEANEFWRGLPAWKDQDSESFMENQTLYERWWDLPGPTMMNLENSCHL